MKFGEALNLAAGCHMKCIIENLQSLSVGAHRPYLQLTLEIQCAFRGG